MLGAIELSNKGRMHEKRLRIENAFPLVDLKLESPTEVVAIFKLGSSTDQAKRGKVRQKTEALPTENSCRASKSRLAMHSRRQVIPKIGLVSCGPGCQRVIFVGF